MPDKLEAREVSIIKAYLWARSFQATVLAVLLGTALYFLATELTGSNPNAALTALLGIGFGALATGLGQMLSAISANVLEYLKDRLGTRGKADESDQPIE